MSEDIEEEIRITKRLDKILNRYELADFITRRVRADIKEEMRKMRCLKARLGSLEETLQKEREMLRKKEAAMNDRTANLQMIYDKMISIEKKLSPLSQTRRLLKGQKELEPLKLEIPFHKKSIFEVGLSPRTFIVLDKKLGIKTLGELTQKTESELLYTENFGKKSLKEVKKVLSDYGLKLADEK